MKRTMTILIMAAAVVATFAGAIGCDAGASCKETCEEDSECADGMSCFLTDEGHICLPSSCGTCFEDGRTCHYSENLDEQEEGELAECGFKECSY